MFDDKSYNQKMDKTFNVFINELTSLRTGRANSSMLDLIKVDVYGQKMLINQLGSGGLVGVITLGILYALFRR